MQTKPRLPSLSARFNSARYSFKTAFTHIATGGEWAHSQSAETRRSLIWFWFDGFFASACDNIVVTYLVVYLLAIGATQAQIGLMSSLSSLSAAALLLPGAWLVERIGRRRGIVLIGGGWARLALLLLALTPFMLQGPALIILAIAFSISRDALANLSFPAWMSMTGDVVPMEGRGRYFASRNFAMGVTGIAATFLVGQMLTRVTGVSGYQIALALAFVIGSVGVFSFSKISDRPQPAPARPANEAEVSTGRAGFNLRTGLRELAQHREFTQFAAVTALWNIALNFAGPFFNVYLVQNLQADAAMVGYTAIASSIAGMLIQFKLGELNDRWGARKLTMISGLLIPIMPLAWAFIDSPWYVIPINMLGGVLWGAYGMGSFNYLLMITPPDRRARYSAIFQFVVTISLAIGAALGSLAITYWGFAGVFLGSSAGRLTAALLFVLLITRKKAIKTRLQAA